MRSPFSSDSRMGSTVPAPAHSSRLKDTVVIGKLSETDQVLLGIYLFCCFRFALEDILQNRFLLIFIFTNFFSGQVRSV
jgi:hypothetical protein